MFLGCMTLVLAFLIIVLFFCLAAVCLYSLTFWQANDSFGQDRSSSKRPHAMTSFVIAVLVITVVWLSGWIAIPSIYGKPENAGVAGDMFGILTSWFSGLAFAGLIATLLMQRKELEYQRSELKDTREEFARQRFESTLFSLLSLWTQHIENLKIATEEDSAQLTGRAVLDYYASELPMQKLYDLEPTEEEFTLVLRERVSSFEKQLGEYEELYKRELETDLGPYFRLLYHSVRHIHHAYLSPEEKIKYSKIVRAHLSSSELDLLFFNCHSDWGVGFKEWIEDYQVLKHIREETREKNPWMNDALSPSVIPPKISGVQK